MAKAKRTRRAPAKAPAKKAARAASKHKADLPPSLAEFARKVQGGLSRVQKQIEGSPASRDFLRLLREASHRLGRLEAEGERRFRKLAGAARKDALGLLKRVEKALEPAKPKAKKPAAKPAPAPVAAAPAPAPVATPVPAPIPTPSDY